jgi:hypothetical protein
LRNTTVRILREPAQEDWDLTSEVVSKDKVRWAIDGVGTFKVPLLHVWRYGYIPLAWRAVRVLFIPTPGRDSYELAKSFRPISLTAFFLKTMKKLVDSYDTYIRAGPLKSFPLMESLQYALPEKQIH